jgi:small subunit ribosomal protein S6
LEKFRAVEPKGGNESVNTYETLVIVNPEVGDGEIAKTIDIVQDVIVSGGGTILKIEKWGKRQLAYEIQRKREGYYVLLYFKAPTDALVELNRRFKLTDAILRSMVLQLGKEQIADLLQSLEAEAEAEAETATVSSETPTEEDEQDAAEEEPGEQESDTDTEDE